MKKTKRLLALLLSVVMLLGMFVVTTSAEDAVVEEETVDGVANVTINTSADTVKAGDIITVTLNVATDYNAAAMLWPILFSDSFFEYVTDSQTYSSALLDLGGRLSLAVNSTDSKNFTPEYTPEDYKCVLFQWTGAISQAPGIVSYKNPEGDDIFTFKLKVKDDVTKGMSGKIVIGNEETFYNMAVNPDVENPTQNNGGIYYGDITFNCTGAEVEFPVPRLEAVEGTSTVVDEENKLIRGLDLNVVDDIDDYAESVGCDAVVVPAIGNRIGTGTTVTLVDEGVEYGTYTIIIAGDVNGDGLVDAIDTILFDLIESAQEIPSDAEKLAADLNGDNQFDVADIEALDASLIFEGEIDQAKGIYVKNS